MALFRYPLIRSYPLSSGFYSPRSWGQHSADDYACPPDVVVAARDGIVSGAGWYGNGGYSIEIGHDNFTRRTRYMHLSKIEVVAGQAVVAGQRIALSGNTTSLVGGVGYHLHFAIWMKNLDDALAVQSDPYSSQTWWAVDPQKIYKMQEPIITPKDDDMKLIRDDNGLICVVGELGRRHIKTQKELEVYQALYGAPLQISNSQMESIPVADRIQQWLETDIQVTYADKSSRILTVQQLFQWQANSLENNRWKWFVHENNFPSTTPPIEAFASEVRKAST